MFSADETVDPTPSAIVRPSVGSRVSSPKSSPVSVLGGHNWFFGQKGRTSPCRHNCGGVGDLCRGSTDVSRERGDRQSWWTLHKPYIPFPLSLPCSKRVSVCRVVVVSPRRRLRESNQDVPERQWDGYLLPLRTGGSLYLGSHQV